MSGKWIFKILALIAVAIGAIDLALGDTNKDFLPAAITNNLSQQGDLFLIVAGGAAFFLIK